MFPVVGFEPGYNGPLNHMQGQDPKTVLTIHTNTLFCGNFYTSFSAEGGLIT